MITKRVPFVSNNIAALPFKIINAKLPPIKQNISPAIRKLIKKMLNKNPKKRPTIFKVLENELIIHYLILYFPNNNKVLG